MKLGIIADTHDNVNAIKRAVKCFNQHGVAMVIHAGDFVAPFALLAFSELNAPLHGVLGNCDGEKLNLYKTAEKLGSNLNSSPYHFEFGGKTILVMHQPAELSALVASQCYDLIVYGHLHKTNVRKEGKTLIVSPGEGGGWISHEKTIALVDLEKSEAEIVKI